MAIERHRLPVPHRAHAAEKLFERHAHRVLAYCRGELESPEDAEDALQATFLNAYRGLERGIEPQAELAWLLKIAENVCLSRRRAAARRRRVERPPNLDEIDEVAGRDTPETTAAELVPALRALPEAQRRAIVLREWCGLSYREICGELGLSQPAVQMLLFRARRSLAAALRVDEQRHRLGGFDLGSLLGSAKDALASKLAVNVATGVAVAAVTTPLVGDRPVIPPSVRPAERAVRLAAPPPRPDSRQSESTGVRVRQAHAASVGAGPRRAGPQDARGNSAPPAKSDGPETQSAPAAAEPTIAPPPAPSSSPEASGSGNGTPTGERAGPASPNGRGNGPPVDRAHGRPSSDRVGPASRDGRGNGPPADHAHWRHADPPPAADPAPAAADAQLVPAEAPGNGNGNGNGHAADPVAPATNEGNGNAPSAVKEKEEP
jgi:RNA polymerase sigma-70 factor (ECF subfamily)